MSSTITNSVTHEVVLGSGTYTSPLTITSTGTVTTSTDAVYGGNSQTWTVANQGHVIGVGANADGVVLRGGGSIANTGAGLIQGYEAVYMNAAGVVFNSGTIITNGATANNAIDFRASGSVDNTGIIQGQNSGVWVIAGSAGTVTNSDTIVGTAAAAVYLNSGGTVTNTGTGHLIGYYGVKILGAAGTVTNSATIQGTGGDGRGVELFAGGSVANTGTGLIQGSYHGVEAYSGVVSNSATIIATGGSGVVLPTGGTVIDSGTISGTNYAVQFKGTGIDRLVLGPGYDLISTNSFEKVTASSGATNTLELASAAGAGTVTAPLATQFVNFGTVTVDAGARWVLNDAITVAGVTVLNAGTILAPGAAGYALNLTNGGSVGNTGTGLILGYAGVSVAGAGGTVTNSGTIDGSVGRGVYLSAGTVVNTGNIYSTNNFYTVEFKGNGLLTNSSTGSIGVGGVSFVNGGTVINAGTIKDTFGGGVNVGGAAGTLTNSGAISGAGAGNSGVVLTAGGSVSNTGTITGAGTGGYGVNLSQGGSVGNTGAGLIRAPQGVAVLSAPGYVTNAATIIGTAGIGVELGDSGTITNSGTILSQSTIGVYILGGAGTIIDSGTISGTGSAVKFGGGSNLLALEAGYKLTGGLYGGSGGGNTLELSGAAGAVTATYNSLGLTDFQDVLFGAAGLETLKATNTSGTLGTVTISGFTLTSDIVDLTQIGTNATLANNGTVSGSDQLTIVGSGGTVTLQLDATDATVFKATSDLVTGSDITAACFCRGTLILTERGEVAVEDLAIGDRVMTISGEAEPIKWIGRRSYQGRFIAGSRWALPVRIKAGALADSVPARDLFVSPAHALYIEGVLVEAEHLLNGATITQAQSIERVEYFHIELAAHHVIFADGAPAETYIDTDNRGIFGNASEYAALYPAEPVQAWQFCAARLEEDAPELVAIRARIARRAGLPEERAA